MIIEDVTFDESNTIIVKLEYLWLQVDLSEFANLFVLLMFTDQTHKLTENW